MLRNGRHLFVMYLLVKVPCVADVLTKSQRSYCMSRIRGKNTSIETLVRSRLHREGLRFRKHVTSLPGSPDVVLLSARLAIFIDGDFWHGYRFNQWKTKLTPFWRAKIEKNIRRDQRNFRALRRLGWNVIRVWESQINRDLDAVIQRIMDHV